MKLFSQVGNSAPMGPAGQSTKPTKASADRASSHVVVNKMGIGSSNTIQTTSTTQSSQSTSMRQAQDVPRYIKASELDGPPSLTSRAKTLFNRLGQSNKKQAPPVQHKPLSTLQVIATCMRMSHPS